MLIKKELFEKQMFSLGRAVAQASGREEHFQDAYLQNRERIKAEPNFDIKGLIAFVAKDIASTTRRGAGEWREEYLGHSDKAKATQSVIDELTPKAEALMRDADEKVAWANSATPALEAFRERLLCMTPDEAQTEMVLQLKQLEQQKHTEHGKVLYTEIEQEKAARAENIRRFEAWRDGHAKAA
jgi:hypothetical protein